MKGSEIREYQECIAALFAGFNAEATEASYAAYWMGLGDMTLESIQRAVATAMRKCRALPKPAELRELIEGRPDERSELAWLSVLSTVPLGPWKHIDFTDGIINATIRSLGGWPTFLTRLTTSEEKWARQEFRKTYDRLSGCGLSDEACAPLAGLSEMQPVPRRIECRSATIQRLGADVQHPRISQRKGEPI